MNKQQLATQIAKEHNISKASANRIIDTISDSIITTVSKGDTFRLRGLGTFKAIYRAAKKGRNIDTGASIDIPPKLGVKFSTGTEFDKELNSGPLSRMVK